MGSFVRDTVKEHGGPRLPLTSSNNMSFTMCPKRSMKTVASPKCSLESLLCAISLTTLNMLPLHSDPSHLPRAAWSSSPARTTFSFQLHQKVTSTGSWEVGVPLTI